MRCRSLPLATAALAAGLLLSGCQQPLKTVTQQVKVAVPIACQEPEPPRPSMPTEHLAGDASVAAYVQAAAAEIERREGYEIQLRQALANCKQPITAADAAIKN